MDEPIKLTEDEIDGYTEVAELYIKEAEEKAKPKPIVPEIPTIKDLHTDKTRAELDPWWQEGVEKQRSEPLADWKTDNPNHPRHNPQERVRNLDEEV